MLLLIVALAATAPAAGSPDRLAQDVIFAPLRRSERSYSSLGPVGPYYPEYAVSAGKNGEAILDCLATTSGVLKRCRIVSETPAGYAFGVAARIMADRRRITAPLPASEGLTVRVRVPFVRGAPVTVAP